MQAHEKQFQIGTMSRFCGCPGVGTTAGAIVLQAKGRMRMKKLLLKIETAHKDSKKRYGSPRIHQQLVKNGIACSRGRVARLMREAGMRARQKRKFVLTTDSNHDLPVAPNLLNQQFAVDTLNTVWTADITCVPTEEGRLYLGVVMDLCSKGIAGWSMEERMKSDLVASALRMAYERRNPGAGLLNHSDRGSQYASQDYQELLKAYGMQRSMSRKGNCWDNAPMESFFHTLKTELTHHEKYRSREEARRSIFEPIEIFYNRQRLHSSLGYKSPAEFEQGFQIIAYAV